MSIFVKLEGLPQVVKSWQPFDGAVFKNVEIMLKLRAVTLDIVFNIFSDVQ